MCMHVVHVLYVLIEAYNLEITFSRQWYADLLHTLCFSMKILLVRDSVSIFVINLMHM